MSTITGTKDDDNLVGTSDDEKLIGGAGDDTLDGGAGDDHLVGAEGNDTLIGSEGDDKLTGGSGDDLFVFDLGLEETNFGTDTITDFKAGAESDDVILLRNSGLFDLAGILALATQIGDDTVIDFGDGNVLVLKDVNKDDLHADDFTFEITGSDENDQIAGTSGDDVINAGGGDDIIDAGGGDDTIDAGDGDDTVTYTVGDGVDAVDGGEGVDEFILQGIDTAQTGVLIEDGATYIARTGDLTFAPDHIAMSINGVLVADLDNIEDLVINAGALGDTIEISGDFSGTDLAPETVTFIGGSGADFFDGRGLTSTEHVFANGVGGDDILYGGAGDDTLIGGPADPTDGSDNLYGGDGDDTLIPGADDNLLDGGDGNDTASFPGAKRPVEADLQSETAEFGTLSEGPYFLNTLVSIENLAGTVYNDILRGDADANILTGRDGDDTLIGRGGNDELHGNLGQDTLQGGDGEDLLYGEADNDTLLGGLGDDELYGGKGNDTLNGGPGDDVLMGGEGDDHLVFQAGGGNDTINGGADTDLLTVNGNLMGDDLFRLSESGGSLIMEQINPIDSVSIIHSLTVDGVENVDFITGGGDDRVILLSVANTDAANGTVTINAGAGSDLVNGLGAENKLVINGGAGGDILNGGTAADEINGGAGNDTIFGAPGDDLLSGGDGNDLFVFGNGGGDDTITDFTAGMNDPGVEQDVISITAFGFDSFNGGGTTLLAYAQDDGSGNTEIDLGQDGFGVGDELTLLGVQVTELHADDFMLT